MIIDYRPYFDYHHIGTSPDRDDYDSLSVLCYHFFVFLVFFFYETTRNLENGFIIIHLGFFSNHCGTILKPFIVHT